MSEFIFSLSDLLTVQSITEQNRIIDRAALSQLVNPDIAVLSPIFINWAAAGYPSNYQCMVANFLPPLSSTPFRDTYTYTTELLGTDLSQQVSTFSSKFDGMTFTFDTPGNTVYVFVSKT